MGRLCNMNKALKTSGRAVVSFLLTFIFFWMNLQHTYNACVIAFVFILVEVCISFLCNKREFITRRGMVVATKCGLVLSVTSLIGSLSESEQELYTGGMQLLAFLIAHTILLGVVSLCLFIRLQEIHQEQNIECKMTFLSKSVRGGAK